MKRRLNSSCTCSSGISSQLKSFIAFPPLSLSLTLQKASAALCCNRLILDSSHFNKQTVHAFVLRQFGMECSYENVGVLHEHGASTQTRQHLDVAANLSYLRRPYEYCFETP